MMDEKKIIKEIKSGGVAKISGYCTIIISILYFISYTGM